MKTESEQIDQLHGDIVKSIMTIDPVFDYDDLAGKFCELCELVNKHETDEFFWCSVGEHTTNIGDLLVGAYWHYTHWHSGQYSDSYRALCSIGSGFDPGMTSEPDPDDGAEYDIYSQLNELAEAAI